MAKKVTREHWTRERLSKLLMDELEHWQEIFEHGCQDPFWPDGVNLNLTRNHILWYRHEIEENLKAEDYPECYSLPVPPEVDQGYIADREGILADAALTLATVRNTQDFAYLASYPSTHRMNEEIDKRLSIVRTMRYLSDAIDRKDYVYMRKYRDWRPLLVQMHDSRMEIQNLEEQKKELPQGQLSIFDFL